MYGLYMIVQHCSIQQTAQAIRFDLDQQINLSIKRIQTALALEDRIKKKGVKGRYGRASIGLL